MACCSEQKQGLRRMNTHDSSEVWDATPPAAGSQSVHVSCSQHMHAQLRCTPASQHAEESTLQTPFPQSGQTTHPHVCTAGELQQGTVIGFIGCVCLHVLRRQGSSLLRTACIRTSCSIRHMCIWFYVCACGWGCGIPCLSASVFVCLSAACLRGRVRWYLPVRVCPCNTLQGLMRPQPHSGVSDTGTCLRQAPPHRRQPLMQPTQQPRSRCPSFVRCHAAACALADLLSTAHSRHSRDGSVTRTQPHLNSRSTAPSCRRPPAQSTALTRHIGTEDAGGGWTGRT